MINGEYRNGEEVTNRREPRGSLARAATFDPSAPFSEKKIPKRDPAIQSTVRSFYPHTLRIEFSFTRVYFPREHARVIISIFYARTRVPFV